MIDSRIAILISAMHLSIGMAAAAVTQDYPQRPIRLVTAGVGGGNDVVTRLLAQGLAERLGQAMVVDNRASSILPAEIVAKAPPDGYTLLSYGNSIWVGQLVRGKMTADPLRDFTPISLVGTGPSVLVVNPSVPAKSVQELIALAKAKPGTLNYSSGATGASSHLSMELFKIMTGVDVVRIPYQSGSTEITDLLSGQVQLTFGSPSILPYVKSGRMRALAVTSAQPSALYPGVPTVASSGLPGYESGSVYGLFAPAKLATSIRQRLNKEIVQFLSVPETRDKYLRVGVEASGTTSKQYAEEVRTDLARWAKLIKDAGIHSD